MSFAGHLPTMNFDVADWQSMRVFEPKEPWYWGGEGFYRTRLKGKPIVVHIAPLDSGLTDFSVRPIVRVKMGRRVVSDNHQMLYEWWHSLPRGSWAA